MRLLLERNSRNFPQTRENPSGNVAKARPETVHYSTDSEPVHEPVGGNPTAKITYGTSTLKCDNLVIPTIFNRTLSNPLNKPASRVHDYVLPTSTPKCLELLLIPKKHIVKLLLITT